MVDVVRHDVVIVGGGGAGLRAAIAVAEADPTLSVALVSKVYPMRSHTVSAEGGAAAVPPGAVDDSLEKHAFDTVKGSDFLGDQDVIQYFVAGAPKELTRLEHWGCPWSRNADGSVATRPFGGMQTPRTWYATDKVGFHMLHTLFQHWLRFDRIHRYDEHFVTKLLVEGGQCRGVAALDVRTGQVKAVLGRAVILTTGGAGKVWPFTTNGNIKTGDGMALAYREGVALKDMEFVQYHPTGLPGTGILITEASRGEGGYVKNSDGERFLVTRDYGVDQKAELGPRDMISRAIMQEIAAGRGVKGAYGEHVWLDLTHLAPIGQEILLNGVPYTVGGRIRKKLQDSNYTEWDDERLFIPYETMRLDFPIPGENFTAQSLSAIIASSHPWVVDDLEKLFDEDNAFIQLALGAQSPVEQEVRDILAPLKGFNPEDTEALGFWNTALESVFFKKMIAAMDSFFLSVSLITLALGGIGVMNLMLVSVRERTHEIGIRKALGASERLIARQFFLEGLMLTLLAGAVGFGVGVGLCSLVNLAPMPERFAGMVVTWPTALLAMATLALVGVLASTYPARAYAAYRFAEEFRWVVWDRPQRLWTGTAGREFVPVPQPAS